jgi:hypothetical protein
VTHPPGNPYGHPGPAEPYDPYASPPPADQAYPYPPPDQYAQYVPYAVPQGPRYYVGVGGLRVAVLVLSALVVAGEWLTAMLAPSAKVAYEDAARRGLPSAEVFTAYDAAGALVVLSIAAWIVTCVWLQRAYQNAAAYQRYALSRSAVWVWLGWIVPIVAFWFPKQIIDDVTRTTARAADVGRGRGTGWWWGMWLLFLFLGNAAGRLGMHGITGEAGEVVIIPGLHLALALTGTIAFVLWLPIVNRISDIQDMLAGRPVPGTPGTQPRMY